MQPKRFYSTAWRLTRLASVFALASAGVSPALATSYTVNSLADNIASDGVITLREAVQAANSNAAVGDAPAGEAFGDIIDFDVTLSGTISLTLGEYALSESLLIVGSDAITINANNASRIFNIADNSGLFGISSLTLTGGGSVTNGGAIWIGASNLVNASNLNIDGNTATGAAAGEGGGAIFNAGNLTLTNSAVTNNTVSGVAGNGGGILSSGRLTVTGGEISGNEANRAGGGIEHLAGTTTLVDVTLSNNIVNTMPGNGGGLHLTAGSVVVQGGTINGNSAGNEGGGLWNSRSGTMTIEASDAGGTTITQNSALGGPADDSTRGGGGLFNLGTMSVTDATVSSNLATAGLLGNGGGIMNSGGTLTITDTEISENSASRAGGGLENQQDGSVTLKNVTLDANTVGPNPGNGGGLHSAGSSVTIIGGSVVNNLAAREGGGLWAGGSMSVTEGTLIDSNIANGNDAEDGGGGVFVQTGGTTTITGATITNNVAAGTAGSGGGVFALASGLSISNSVISDNTANRAGGGIETKNDTGVTLSGVTMDANNAGAAPATAAPGNGGAIHVSGSGSMTISDSVFTNNLAAREGGALWAGGAATSMSISDSTIDSNIASGAAAHDGGGGLFINGGTVAISNTTISNNIADGASGSGGGILNLTGRLSVIDSTVNGNSSSRAGGGLEDNSNGDGAAVAAAATTVTIDNSTFDSNETGASPGNGGAIHITGNGTMEIDNSTFSNNVAAKEGGGLWNFSSSNMTVTNSTIVANQANGSGDTVGGGGVFNQAGAGVLTLINSTVANNSASAAGGGVRNTQGGNFTLINTLIGGNSAGTGPDASGSFAGDYNLLEDSSDATLAGGHNVLDQDPELGELGLYGGSTQTILISSGPSIDAASNGDCPSLDQRGFDRPADGDVDGKANCDIGAFEFAGNVVGLTATTGAKITTVDNADAFYPALGVTVSASGDEDVVVNGFSGVMLSSLEVAAKVFDIALYVDSDADGAVSAADIEIGAASIEFQTAARSFSVAFATPRTITAGASESYLITLNFASPAAAALSLLMLPLMWLVARGRRAKRVLLTLVGSLGLLTLVGCSDSPDNDGTRTDIKLRLTQIDATTSTSGEPVVGIPLPVDGPTLRVIIE